MIAITAEIKKIITALTAARCTHIFVNERFVVGFTGDQILGDVHNRDVRAAEPPIASIRGMTMHERIRYYIATGYWLIRGGCVADCIECKVADMARLDYSHYTPDVPPTYPRWRMYGHEMVIIILYAACDRKPGEWMEYVFDPITRKAITFDSFTRHDSVHARVDKRRSQGFVVEHMDCNACRACSLPRLWH